ncbi:hypothetical protein Tco_1213228 [Tanacetum coccineum]
MLHTCYEHSLTKGTKIQIFYHGLDDPTQETVDARGIFHYKTPNGAFKILEDKVFLKLDFPKDYHNSPYPKIVVSAGGSKIISDHEVLMDKFKALAPKIDSKFLNTRRELKEMRNDRIRNGVLTKKEFKKDDMGLPKANKEWKLNEKVVVHDQEFEERARYTLRRTGTSITFNKEAFQDTKS